MVRDEVEGGTAEDQPQYVYVHSPIAVLLWRVRLGTATVAVFTMIGGESVGLVFAAALGVAFVVMVAGSAMARIEARVHALHRQGRRR